MVLESCGQIVLLGDLARCLEMQLEASTSDFELESIQLSVKFA